MMKHVCQNCGSEFEATTKEAKYCLECRNTMRMKHTSETIKKKYGVDWYVQTPNYYSKSKVRVSAENKKFESILDKCRIQYEEEFSIGPKQYDLFLPEYNLLVEIDPTYTHNSFKNHWEPHGISFDYQITKSKVAWKANHRCIHIFDWDNSESIITDIIRNKMNTTLCEGSDMSKFFGIVSDDELQYISEPNILWSKGTEVINCTDVNKFEELIKNKWLPMFDCGTYTYIDQESKIASYEAILKKPLKIDRSFPPRACDYCGKIYIPKSAGSRYCPGPHYMKCPVCGKYYIVTYNDKLKNPPTACSYVCRTVRRTQTSLEKYGCTAPGNNPEARKKASATMMKKLGVPYAMMNKEVREKSRITMIERYGVDNIKKLGPEYTKAEKEPEFKFTIFPWDNKEIITKMLQLEKIKLHSEDFTIYRLNKPVGDQFLIENCPLGTCRGQTLYLGLVKDMTVYQVMTFGKASHSKKYDIQIMRMCTKLGYEFEDGYSTLFSYATSEYGMYNIVTYCDFSKYDGSDCTEMGMKFDHMNTPRLVWSKDDKKCTEQLRIWKHMSKEDMIDDGWIPVYDCGQKAYVF